LEGLLVKLGIEDERPESNKHLNYSKINASTIRIFNKVNHDMNEQGIEKLEEFIGEENLDDLEVEIGGEVQILKTIAATKLQRIFQEKGIINYGQDLDDDFIYFVSLNIGRPLVGNLLI
jgi:hypothetical protein